MKTKNLKEFKALILRYESITIEEIKRKPNVCKLTGFASKRTCSLCRPLDNHDYSSYYTDCSLCVWGRIEKETVVGYPCNSGENAKTYERIYKAETPEKILNAYYARAKYMRSVLEKLGYKQP